MKNQVILFLVLFPLALQASAPLDAELAVRHIAVAVVNLRTEPVYGETVETALRQTLKKNSRFDVEESMDADLRARLAALPAPTIGEANALAPGIAPLLAALAAKGIDCVVLAELVQDGSGERRLRAALFPTGGNAKLRQTEVTVTEPDSLDGYVRAGRVIGADLIRAIPFQATVLSREGDRIVLDRGYPFLRRGVQIPVFTISHWENGEIQFERSGVINVSRVEADLAFGNVLSETFPGSIAVGNKVRQIPAGAPEVSVARRRSDERSLSSLSEESITRPRSALGEIGFGLGLDSVSWQNAAASGTGIYKASASYLDAELSARLILTPRFFAEIGFGFGSASLSGSDANAAASSVQSSEKQLSAFFAYRLDVDVFSLHPALYVKAGLGHREFNAVPTSDPLSPADLAYTGFLIGAGATVPLTEKIGAGVDAETLLLGTASEDEVTSGSSTTGASWFDFSIRGYYKLLPEMELGAALSLLSNRASFTGSGTRTIALSSSSQSGTALGVGANYRF